jgi:catechol 2,3-dioxygenase-like lactoylglutathione lyase family enzyme
MEIRACIDVDDLDRAIAFYERALGLNVMRRFRIDWAEMVGGSSVIDLLAKDSATAPCPGSSVRSYSRHLTPVHLDFVVTNLDEAVQRATAAGAVLERDIDAQKRVRRAQALAGQAPQGTRERELAAQASGRGAVTGKTDLAGRGRGNL